MNAIDPSSLPTTHPAPPQQPPFSAVVNKADKTAPDALAKGEEHAQIALAHFRREEYATAASHYATALTYLPDQTDWQIMLTHAQHNAIAELQTPVPAVTYFQREQLLAPPVVPAGALPTTPLVRPAPGLLKRCATLLGNGLGSVLTVTMHGLTQSTGAWLGYRDAVWTNWYRRPLLLGILTLAYMRERLNAQNLKNSLAIRPAC